MPINSRQSEPKRTLRSFRRLFLAQASDQYQSWLEVAKQLNGAVTARAAPAAGLRRKHESFRFGLSGWLESLVKLAMDEAGRLSRVAACHPDWLGDNDPAQWARNHIQEFLRESLKQEVSDQVLHRAFQEGASLLSSKDNPSSNDSRPAVERWFRIACEGGRDHRTSKARSTKPWCAPPWCADSFSVILWIKRGRPRHLTVEQTDGEIRIAQHLFAGRLEHALGEAEDQQRVELASRDLRHTDSSPSDSSSGVLTPKPNASLPHLNYPRSALKRAIALRLTQKPNATNRALCDWLDEESAVDLPPGWVVNGGRSFVEAYRDPKRKANIESQISKVRKDMRDRQLLH